MQAILSHHGQTHRFDLSRPTSLALPLRPDSAQNPNCYYATMPQTEIIRSGDFVGSVALGGSVNYRSLSLTPHGNGTHTECLGHLTAEPVYLPDCLRQPWMIAQLLSLRPQRQGSDWVILAHQVLEYLQGYPALILRSLPNTPDKKTQHYSGTNPPYLSPELGQALARAGVEHLLVDLPSVDKERDEGKLLVHRGFWGLDGGNIRYQATITELIYVPDDLPEGCYLLNLQVPALYMDAVPSQPVVFPTFQEKDA
ncbi:MAG: cyclase family protein [Bernardetiaceae bacterium]